MSEGVLSLLQPAPGADVDRAWRALHTTLTALLAEHGLRHVIVERAEEQPVQSAGGEYRTVIPPH